MIFRNYRDTTMAYKALISDSKDIIETAYINGTLGPVFVRVGDTDVIGMVHKVNEKMVAQYPTYYGGRSDFCVVDVSQFTDKRSTPEHYKVVAQRDFQLRIAMACLEVQWAKEEYSKWRVEYAEAGGWFVSFLAKRLTTQFNLDPYETSQVEVLIAMYWNNLVKEGWSDMSQEQATKDINKHIYTTADIIEDVYSKNLKYENINELAISLSKVLNSPKLRGFDAVTLVQLSARASFGVGMDDIINIALEYPPYWVAAMYVSLNDKSYKHTFLARLVKRPSIRLTQEMTKLISRS